MNLIERLRELAAIGLTLRLRVNSVCDELSFVSTFILAGYHLRGLLSTSHYGFESFFDIPIVVVLSCMHWFLIGLFDRCLL
jgi:hypothetical protein